MAATQRAAHQPPQALVVPSKTNDLAREAVGCMGVFGGPRAVVRVVTRPCRPHSHRTTPAQRTSI